MKTRIAAALSLACGSLMAQELKSGAHACFGLDDQSERLACYDQALKRPLPEPKAGQPLPPVRFLVLQKGDYDNFANPELTDKPATIDFQRKDGDNTSRVKFGVLAVGRALSDAGWQPYASVAWDRDNTGAREKRKDFREAGIGITGTVVQSADLVWSLASTARYRYRQDVYGGTDGNLAGWHFNLVNLHWVAAKPLIFVPYAGLLLEKRNGGAETDGRWHSVYAGAALSVPLNSLARGLSISLAAERFRDYSAPGGQEKRSASSALPGISYEFTDPDDAKVRWRPSIGLSRQIGEDLRGGSERRNDTLLSFGIKYK